MKFKNYCLVVLGRVEGVKDEISKISETAVRYVDAKGIVIATFSTIATALELREFFTLNNRSFVLFELGDDNYGVNITNKAIHEHLFGEIEVKGPGILNSLTNRLMSEIGAIESNIPEPVISGSSNPSLVKTKKTEFEGIDFSTLTISQREELVNKILDKGAENLNEKDKILLKKIAKTPKK